ncbi:GMC oxidoreductase, partial [Amanita thiersii Skay4041]
NEHFVPPANNHNITGEFDPTVHLFSGVNSVSLPGFAQVTDKLVFEATKQLSDKFPFNRHMNGGNHLGIGWMQSTVTHEGRRSSSAVSYLNDQVLRRKNLDVLIHAQVTRLITTPHKIRDIHQVSARKAEFVMRGTTGPFHTVSAEHEVILSAGSIGTPHILHHSGIGDSTFLKSIGISPIVNLPSVGRNLTDHPLVISSWRVNSTQTLDDLSRNETVLAQALKQWQEEKQGPLVIQPITHAGFLRLGSEVLNQALQAAGLENDPAASDRTPHIEIALAVSFDIKSFRNGGQVGELPLTGNFMTMATGVVSPVSRGSVLPSSSFPFDTPQIDVAFLDSEFDLIALKESVRSAAQFLSAPAWTDYVVEPFTIGLAEGLAHDGDEALTNYVRNRTVTFFHPVSTAAMSPNDASWGVVDPDLKLKKVAGVRVVDASVFPIIPAAHTQVPVYVIAERAADLIKLKH